MEKQGSGCFLLKGQQEEVICFFPSFFFFLSRLWQNTGKLTKSKVRMFSYTFQYYALLNFWKK